MTYTTTKRIMTFALLCAMAMALSGCAGFFALPVWSAAPAASPHTPTPEPHAPSPRPTARETSAGQTSAVKKPEPTGSGTPAGADTGMYTVVCGEYLTLRSAPALSAKPLGRILTGTQVWVDGFDGPFARVTAGGQTGYVLCGYLVPVHKDGYLAGLDVVKPAESYSHRQMLLDLERLVSRYPGKLRLESAGTSLEGRDIPVAVVGDPGAGRHILLQGGIHGREHMTSLLLMAQLEYCLKYTDAALAGKGPDGVCLHVLPMANPDGIEISRKARMTDTLRPIYLEDRKRGNTDLSPAEYLMLWKANAAGVDINRNFPSGWQELDTRDGPSFGQYKGDMPADQPETLALMRYTRRVPFSATISYHATGSSLFWQYGGNERVNRLSRELALALNACTQYPLQGSDELDAGGFKDWAMDTLGIPSVTIEIGSRPCPLPLDEFHTVWARNRDVPAAAAEWVSSR